MKRKNLMGLLLVMAVLATGCSGTSTATDSASADSATSEAVTEEGESVTLTMMNHTSEEATIAWEDSVIEAFEESHPGVTIEISRSSYDDYIQQIQTKFASGDAPDLFYVEAAYIDKYVDNGYIGALDDLDLASKFEDGAYDMLSKDGVAYALPWGTSTMCVTYNKDVFEAAGVTEIPTTLDEFYAACQQIEDAGYTAIGAAYADTWCLMADFQADADTSVLPKDSNAIIDLESRDVKWVDSEAYRGVLERLQERQQYANKDVFGTDWDTVCTAIANGETAMALNGSWTDSNIRAMNPDANIGVFALPVSDDAADALLPIQGGNEGIAYNPEGAHTDVAKEFIDYFTSAEAGQGYTDQTGNLSIVKGVSSENATGGLADIISLMNNGGSVSLGATDHNFTSSYRDAVQTVVSDFLLNGLTVDEALENLDTEFDRIANS